MLRAVFVFADGVERVWLNSRQIARILKDFERNMREEPEWLTTLAKLGFKPDMVALMFCGDTGMRAYQKKFRKLDRTTDILSFPAAEIVSIRETAELWSRGEKELGSLVISLDAVLRGARRAGRLPKLELAEVIVHGLLHLCGCEHVRRPRDAQRMRRLQKRLFKRAKAIIK